MSGTTIPVTTFFRKQDERDMRNSQQYRLYAAATDPAERVVALATAVHLEPNETSLGLLEQIAQEFIDRNPEHPVGWYGKAVRQLWSGMPEGYESLEKAYEYRAAEEEFSLLCLSFLNTLTPNEAVRSLTERFYDSTIHESGVDQFREEVAFAKNRIK